MDTGADVTQLVLKTDTEMEYGIADYLDLIRKYEPEYVIIEHNGMKPLAGLVDMLESFRLRGSAYIDRIYHIIDAASFEIYIRNMGEIIREQIACCTDAVVRNLDAGTAKKQELVKGIHAINGSLDIYEAEAGFDDFNKLSYEKGGSAASGGIMSKLPILILMALAGILAGMAGARIYDMYIDFSRIQVFVTIFVSILVQAAPFILLGVIVSAVIQVLVSEETIARLFPKNRLAGSAAAVIFGAAFPVCDCAVVPVAGRLIKKGVPASAAITFMLVSPIVNPVVLVATYYAFLGNYKVVLCRAILGIIIAGLTGIIFGASVKGRKDFLLEGAAAGRCYCEYCTTDMKGRGGADKLVSILKHSASEFVQTMTYLTIGAFLSSLLQFVIPQSAMYAFGSSKGLLPLVVMMFAAFVLSVCSTSDAFIARTFINQFSMGSIMGFLVLGPMIDIKNTLMLLGTFKKKQVAVLMTCLLLIALAVLGIADFMIW